MEKPHACHLCPARFTNRKTLQNHVLKHTCERPYVCPVCKRDFCWRSAYYAHVRKVHGGVKALAANTDSGIKTTTPSDHLTTGPRVSKV
ncbi:hypothetical protein HPB50_023941 [Hyalomma asiaticum]|uniref:Uncharacterized protein n=1 Tax=Hyalomma asiaticum TaxID=266040 RepID=A0ACB7T499_HYAAI|nr:hypothetical protein HPB50_023941 [Hyalomma asiaticum]